jgi:hypothetical protein
MPFKTWSIGEEVLASEFNPYIQGQTVPQFTTNTQRDALWTSPPNGAMCVTTDTYVVWLRVAGAWVSYREMGFSQQTSTIVLSGVTAATANTIVALGPIPFDGNPVLVEFYAAQLSVGAGVGTSIMCNLWDGSTDIGYLAQAINSGTGAAVTPCYAARRLTPTPGSHAYGVRAWVPAGAGGSVGAGPGGIGQLPPSFIRVTRAL